MPMFVFIFQAPLLRAIFLGSELSHSIELTPIVDFKILFLLFIFSVIPFSMCYFTFVEDCYCRYERGCTMKQIVLKGVSKVYNPTKESAFYALKNIDLEIQSGECVILKGVSGSGKSTLFIAYWSAQ